jgi:hypothetical protein
METRIALFKGKEIRKTIHENEWWFSVVDIIEVLTDSKKPRDYWYRLKKRERESSGVELSTFCRQLKLEEIVNTENAFRIIQSIPSPKAEPFKRWLAKVGYERIQEIEDPELATKRTRALYKAKGYSDDWIEKRMRGIAIREELTDEWKDRGVNEIIINAHHFAGQIIDFLDKKQRFNIRIEISHENELLDTGGGLQKAGWFFNDANPFLLHNVDVLTDIDNVMIAFGCTGGQHRSVYCANQLAAYLSEKHDVDIDLRHREWEIK